MNCYNPTNPRSPDMSREKRGGKKRWGIQRQWVLLKILEASEAIKLEKPVKLIYMKVTYPLLR